ncbi:MAG: hypothetical protein Q9170_002097 [Blastenia crenularia]
MPPPHSPQVPETLRQQTQQESANGMNPPSALLQDLLREKKAAQHARRTSQSEQASYEREVQSSPIAPSIANQVDKSNNRRASGNVAPKEMGLREMEDYISKINKQNFDLKLELFHRRQRTDALEAKAKRTEELEVQNEELDQVNDDLLQELEKRDVAVQEAVALICDLEAKIDQLEIDQVNGWGSNRLPTKTFDDLNAPRTCAAELPITPSPSYGNHQAMGSTSESNRPHTPTPSRVHRSKQEKSPVRSPSFMRDAKPSTSALRGLFTSQEEGLNANASTLGKPSVRSLGRAGSFLSQDEYPDTMDGDTLSLNPRRLSLLSESSFISVYGKGKEKTTPSTGHRDTPTGAPSYEDDVSFTRKLSPQEGRIRSWIESKDHPASPKHRPIQSTKPNAFSSIGEVLGPSHAKSKDSLPSPSPILSGRQRQNVPSQPLGKTSHKPTLEGPIFGHDILPPTPGTMSTATLGGRSSNHSIVAERSLNNGMSRPNSSTTAVSSGSRPFGLSSGDKAPRSGRSPPHGSSAYDDETDIDTSGDERHPTEAELRTSSGFDQFQANSGGFSQGQPLAGGNFDTNRVPGPSYIQRPPHRSNCTDFMFNGEDIESIRPARTVSYRSSGSSHQSPSKDPSKLSRQPSASSKNHSRNGGRDSSIQQDAAFSVESTFPRPLSPAQLQYDKPSTPPSEITPPQSKLRPPRPSSLYMRSNSTQSPSIAPARVPRVCRPETSSAPAVEARRHSVSFKNDDVHYVGEGKEKEQQQNKRLSVGAIGRSASLKIKEGFGRKK